MINRIKLVALGLLFTIPGIAADAPRTTKAELVCGLVRLRAQTTSVAHVAPDNGLIWTKQTIQLTNADGTSRAFRVRETEDDPGFADRGLPAIISSWQCLHGSHELVIELWLTCSRADLGGVCGSQREWERLFDLKGDPLDTDYVPQDARYEALTKQLGILDDGVRLQDALGD